MHHFGTLSGAYLTLYDPVCLPRAYMDLIAPGFPDTLELRICMSGVVGRPDARGDCADHRLLAGCTHLMD
jgi:hypothetical protein